MSLRFLALFNISMSNVCVHACICVVCVGGGVVCEVVGGWMGRRAGMHACVSVPAICSFNYGEDLFRLQ